jgi:hypothetical protein
MHSDRAHLKAQAAISAGSHDTTRGRNLAKRALDEAKRFLVMFLYLWIILGLFALHKRIILGEQGIGFALQGFALLNALVLAKVMLVAEDLDLARWLRGRPLIYQILYESLLFTVVFICFHVVEDVVMGLIHGKTFAASVPVIGGGGVAGLLCVAAILFVALMPYFAFGNVSRMLGPGRLNAILFGTAATAAGEG